jgi:hypothetical protein
VNNLKIDAIIAFCALMIVWYPVGAHLRVTQKIVKPADGTYAFPVAQGVEAKYFSSRSIPVFIFSRELA